MVVRETRAIENALGRESEVSDAEGVRLGGEDSRARRRSLFFFSFLIFFP